MAGGYPGYSGKILMVDLDGGSFTIEPLPQEWCEEFLGGFGVNNRLCLEIIKPGTDPLSPDNPVVLGAGPLVGTLAPGASRVMANSRFPLTGAVSSASGGMGLGPQMRWAGYDHVVLRGAAPRPVYLLIDDEGARCLDAADLWGTDIFTCTDRLRDRHPGASVMAIGPAGENLVSFSLALIDKGSTLGRGGLGAVLGAKHVKAVVIKGSRGIRIADEKVFLKTVRGLRKRMEAWPYREPALQLGMLGGWPVYVEQIAARKGREEAERVRAAFGPEAYLRIKRGRFACPSCFLADKDVLALAGGLSCSTSFLNAAILGAALDLADAGEAASLLDHLDRLGLCFITFLNLCVFLLTAEAAEAGEAGALPSEGFALDAPGGYERWLRLAEMTARREGLGEVLASGWDAVFKHFGPASREFAAVVKGQDCLYDPRASGLGTMEFEQLVSPRGPTSASAGSPTYLPGQDPVNMRRLTSRMGVPEEALARIFDGPGGFNVGRLTRYSEDWFSLFSCLGVCNRAQINRLYHADIFRDLVGSATGMQVSSQDLMVRAAASWELYRRLNEREGFTRAGEGVPAAWFPGGATSIPDYFGNPLSREDLERLLADYHDERSRSAGVIL